MRVAVDLRRYIYRSILTELMVAGRTRSMITRSLRIFRVDLLKSRQHIYGAEFSRIFGLLNIKSSPLKEIMHFF